MHGLPRIPFSLELIAGAVSGFALAGVMERQGEAAGPWIALGVGIVCLLGYVVDRSPAG